MRMSLLGPARAAALCALSLLLGCKIDTDKVADHALYAENGDTKAGESLVSFAVIGNTWASRSGAASKAAGTPKTGVTDALIDSIHSAAQGGGPSFVAFTGDQVQLGTAGSWQLFDRQWSRVLDGYTLSDAAGPEDGEARISAVPVMGDREGRLDIRYRGAEGAFPGTGAAIGFNRVGSWSAFDVETGDQTWRLLFLDSNKAKLGSRWREQLAWIPRALEGEMDGILLFMHEPLYDLGGSEPSMNRNGAPHELLQLIEDHSSLTGLVAVFTGGSHTSQALMPDGHFGAIHIGAGGGGALSEDLRRWGPAEGTERRDDLVLEPLFDLALQGALDEVHAAHPLPELTIDEARAQNSFEGFRGTYDSQHFPIHGWWEVQLDAGGVTIEFWHHKPGPSVEPIYRARYTEDAGWSTMRI